MYQKEHRLGIAAAISWALSSSWPAAQEQHSENAQEREQELRSMLKKARAFRENPQEWWRKHRAELLMNGSAQYVVECVDEGDDIDVFLKQAGQPLPENFDVLSVPGSGFGYERFADDLGAVGSEKIVGITSHRDCGRCDGDDTKAIEYARGLAGKVGVPYLGHVDVLQRTSFHVALGSNLRYTSKVRNPRFCKDAPRYFDASQWCISDRNARLENVKLMLKIAYHHGFNDLLVRREVPYELCVWYDPKHSQFTKAAIAEEVREAFEAADVPDAVKKTLGLLKLTFIEVT